MCVSKDLELMECPAQAMAAFSGQGEEGGLAASSNHCEEILIPLMPRSSGAESSEGEGFMAGLLRESHITRNYFKHKSIASKKAGQVVEQEANADAEETAEEDEDNDEIDNDNDDGDDDINDEGEDEEDEEEGGEDHSEHTRKHRHHHNQRSRSSEDDCEEDFYPPPGPPISLLLLFTCLGALLGVGLVTLNSSWAKSRLLAFDYQAIQLSRPSKGMMFQMSTTADSPMASKV
jgi:hypothetical protein